MNLDDVRRIKIPRQKKHRVGRGSGSGWGVTSGRGNKGAGSRSGERFRLRFEGGQMPIYRRLPKKGFNNGRFQVEFHAVNVGLMPPHWGGPMGVVDAPGEATDSPLPLVDTKLNV